MFNIAIIDDSKAELLHIEKLVINWAHSGNIHVRCDMFSSSAAFLAHASEKEYDVVFADIYMNDTDGIEMVSSFRQSFPTTPIIFITTSDEHHADAFSVHAFDYLQKPVCQEQLNKVMYDLSIFKGIGMDNAHMELNIGKSRIRVLYSNIRYITSDSNYLLIHTDKVLRCRMPFKKLDVLLDDVRFLVINRGVLVNLDYVSSMNDGICRMSDGTVLPINTKRVKAVTQAFIDRQFDIRTRWLTREYDKER